MPMIRRPLIAALLVVLASIVAPDRSMAQEAAMAEARVETLRLRNRSGVDLVRAFASPVSDAYWRDDILGDYILEPGRNLDVTIRNLSDCAYDLLMMFADGAVVVDRIDVCAAESYTIQP